MPALLPMQTFTVGVIMGMESWGQATIQATMPLNLSTRVPRIHPEAPTMYSPLCLRCKPDLTLPVRSSMRPFLAGAIMQTAAQDKIQLQPQIHLHQPHSRERLEDIMQQAYRQALAMPVHSLTVAALRRMAICTAGAMAEMDALAITQQQPGQVLVSLSSVVI